MDRKGGGFDLESDPEAGHDFEVFNCQLISSRFQCVSKSIFLDNPKNVLLTEVIATCTEQDGITFNDHLRPETF